MLLLEFVLNLSLYRRLNLNSNGAFVAQNIRPLSRRIIIRRRITFCYRVLHCFLKLEFGMYPQSMPTEWTHVRTVRAWQSVRLDL